MSYVGCFISVARVDGFPPFSLIQRTPMAQAISCEARPNLMIGTLEAESQYDWLSDMCMKIIRTDDFYSCVEDEWAPSFARVHFDNAWGCFRISADIGLIKTPGALNNLINAFDLPRDEILVKVELDEDEVRVLLRRGERSPDVTHLADLLHYDVVPQQHRLSGN